jgi:hypothetical protein
VGLKAEGGHALQHGPPSFCFRALTPLARSEALRLFVSSRRSSFPERPLHAGNRAPRPGSPASMSPDHVSGAGGTFRNLGPSIFDFLRQVIATDGPVILDGRPGHRDAQAGLERLRRVRKTTRVSVLRDRPIGPRDKGSGLDDGGIGRVDRRLASSRPTWVSWFIDGAVMHDRRRCRGRPRSVSRMTEVGVVDDGGRRRG